MNVTVTVPILGECLFCDRGIQEGEPTWQLLGGATAHKDCYKHAIVHDDDPPEEPEDFYQ